MIDKAVYIVCLAEEVLNLYTIPVYIYVIENFTLIEEAVYARQKRFFSFDIIFEAPAGPGHYMTLVHSRWQANGKVMDSE